MSRTNLSVIFAIADAGGRICPMAKGTKNQPAIPNNLNLGTSCRALIEEWDGRFPDCNYALVCGSTSRRWVLDFDKEGLEWFYRMVDLYGPEWARTPIVLTRRGFHLHFLHPEWMKEISSNPGDI